LGHGADQQDLDDFHAAAPLIKMRGMMPAGYDRQDKYMFLINNICRHPETLLDALCATPIAGA
jgi:hypothetical protein